MEDNPYFIYVTVTSIAIIVGVVFYIVRDQKLNKQKKEDSGEDQ